MKTSRIVVALTIFSALLLVIFLFVPRPQDNPFGSVGHQGQITADKVYNPDNLQGLEHLAMKGNATAAFNLFAYYSFIHQPHAPGDDAIAQKWLKLAAENGDPDAMLELATVIKNKGGPKNCEAAVALARKASRLTSNRRIIVQANNILASFKESSDCSGPI